MYKRQGLAGIRAVDGTTGYRSLVIQPKLVGDLTSVTGRYETPHGVARSEWTTVDGRFTLAVVVPPNTAAEVWVPLRGGHFVRVPDRAELLRVDGDHAVYRAPSGAFTFVSVAGT